ncbi:ESPR-type extended signal peptide-containing protein [Paraburkholderia metrosideri]|uniref:ESPR-type extended signal peptide-containing protein n=1 Tax=Paraburkholderia metrosideri TaxID=580937 RepID=UPI0038B3E31C
MNKSYISVWNEALGSWVAASENTRARGKRSSSRVVAGIGIVAVVLSGVSGMALAAVITAPLQAQDGLYSTGAASATGGDSVAVGAGFTACQQGGTAVGASSTAGYNGSALGIQSNASGNGSSALGWHATSSGTNSTAIGSNTNSAGDNSVALGEGRCSKR